MGDAVLRDSGAFLCDTDTAAQPWPETEHEGTPCGLTPTYSQAG